MKGIMNYVQEKYSLLKKHETNNLSIDGYLIRDYQSVFFRFLLRIIGRKELVVPRVKKEKQITIENLTYTCLWIRYGLLEWLFDTKIRKQFVSNSFKLKTAPFLKKYDVIASHTILAHELANYIRIKYNIPYIATWHGSDIFVVPNQSPYFRLRVSVLLEGAALNLFVSRALLHTALNINDKANMDVIYTGPASCFYEYLPEKKMELRKKLGGEGKKVVVYVGNIVPIKNVMLLPDIFHLISQGIGKENVVFWIIGQGQQKKELLQALDKKGLNYTYWGNVEPDIIPDFLNSSDLLTLVSKNEGLGLVNMEAIKCGCNVVGSKVGGIPEVVEPQNVFDLGDGFVEKISHRAIYILRNNIKPAALKDEFSWSAAIEKELNIYKSLIGREPTMMK